MIINVAGAGAGKTTSLAQEIIDQHKTTESFKNIYCVAFTNNAVDAIKGKLISYYKQMPHNIIVCTIHSFLCKEFIAPYYYLLYTTNYSSVTDLALPSDNIQKRVKLSTLEKKGVLHVDRIPERAKWVIDKKSNDRKHQKDIRKLIMKTFLTYCEIIFVDEAQDINSDMKAIFSALDKNGARIILKGDPKQDIRGHKCFRNLMIENKGSVTYDSTCHRCPISHLVLTNSLIPHEEIQISEKSQGDIYAIYENDFLLSSMISKYDLKYIHKKNDRFETHLNSDSQLHFNNLLYEVETILSYWEYDTDRIKIVAYNLTHSMLTKYKNGIELTNIVNNFAEGVSKHTKAERITREQYARICGALKNESVASADRIVVNSIESIKGMEGKNCLFILTTDLAAYLFGNKSEESKTKNALYVALTRSTENLTILICKEVEDIYGRDAISIFLSKYNIETITG